MAESRNKKYSSERNQLVAMPPIVTTVLGTELGTTLLFGFKQQHHCRDGLLPLLVTLPLIMAESRPSSSSVLARPRGWHTFEELHKAWQLCDQAAITAGLAHGRPLERAVEDALDFVYRAIAAAPGLGKGHGPLNHFVPAPPRPPTDGL